MASHRSRFSRASASASCASGVGGGSGGRPASSQRCRSSRVNRGTPGAGPASHPTAGTAPRGRTPRSTPTAAPRRAPRSGTPAGPPAAAAATARPGRPVTAAWAARCPHPGPRPRRVELGRHRVELAPVLADHPDRHQVDGRPVLDELAVVEDSAFPSCSRWSPVEPLGPARCATIGGTLSRTIDRAGQPGHVPVARCGPRAGTSSEIRLGSPPSSRATGRVRGRSALLHLGRVDVDVLLAATAPSAGT